MIVADTSILSTFARIQRLDLLFTVAETKAIHLPTAIVKEIQAGLNKGLDFLKPIIAGLDSGINFYPITLTPDEIIQVDTLPSSLNAGERESFTICSNRVGNKLLTNDKRAHNYCRENHIPSLDLKLILRQLWKAGYCN